jgi:hypothetical protein
MEGYDEEVGNGGVVSETLLIDNSFFAVYNVGEY